MKQHSSPKSPIFYEILEFLIDHRDAQDTLEGIMEWWLLEQRIKHETNRVKEALAELVAEGFVLERIGGDSRIYYRINRSKYEEIRLVLGSKA